MPDLLHVKSSAVSIPVVGPGVKLNAPPTKLLGPILAEIEAAIATLPPGTNGAFLAVGDMSGVNASVVVKAPWGFKVTAWVGKDWKGPLEGGVKVLRTW